MRKDFSRRQAAHVRTDGVCAEHREFFDATAAGRGVRAALAASVAKVDRLLVLQRGWIEDTRAATEQRRRARRAIRDAMTAIATIGRTMRLPDTATATMRRHEPMADGVLLACARALVDRVSPHADAFVAAGLPAAVFAALDASIPRLDAAIQAQAGYRQRFSAASDIIRDALNDADTAITVLDVVARHTPDAPPELLVRLRIAKRVGHRARRQSGTAPDARLAPAEARTSLPAIDDRHDERGLPRAARFVHRLRAVWSRARGPGEQAGPGAVVLPLRRYG